MDLITLSFIKSLLALIIGMAIGWFCDVKLKVEDKVFFFMLGMVTMALMIFE